MSRIVIIIPTYNEAENIGRMLDIIVREEFPKISATGGPAFGGKNHDLQILVVDSKSPDGTAKIVRERMKKYKQVHLLETKKGGLGADYVKGMKYAMYKLKADAVMEFDADFQHDPKDIKRLIEALDRGADYVIGSRYIKGGGIPKEWGIHRKAMSFFGSLFARVVLLHLNLHDMTSGLKLTKTEFLKKVNLDNLYSKYYAYKLHILHDIVKQGAKTVEVPIIFYERLEGTSKISRKDLIDSFLVVIRLRLRDSKNFIKFGVVGFIGYLINAFGLEFFANRPIVEALASHFLNLKNQLLLDNLSHSIWWAAIFATELAIVSNYTLNNFWTFKENRITNPIKFIWKFLQFNLTSLGAIIMQPLVVTFAVRLFGDTQVIRQVALVIAIVFIVVPYNYTMYNVFIWKRWRVPGLGFIQDKSLSKHIKENYLK